MNDIKNFKDFRENKLLKMTKKEKDEGFARFLEGIKELNLDKDKELEILYKIRGVNSGN